jgi:hypothetical protein
MQGVAGFAKDVGEKTVEVCKSVSPKLKDATKAVVIKTAEMVDSISKTLNEAVAKMQADAECEGDCCKDEEDKSN